MKRRLRTPPKQRHRRVEFIVSVVVTDASVKVADVKDDICSGLLLYLVENGNEEYDARGTRVKYNATYIDPPTLRVGGGEPSKRSRK